MRPRLIIIGDVILEDANTQPPTRTFISARGAGWSRSFFCHLTLFCYTERVLMENRNGIMIDLRVGQASGRAESEPGLEMLQELRGPRRITVAGDKGYDTGGVRGELPRAQGHSHVAQNERRPGGSAL